MIFNEEPKQTNRWRRIASVVYIIVAINILWRVFAYVFSTPSSIAVSLAMLITLLTSYPINIKGTANGWVKDKRQWTFLAWSVFSVIVSALTFLAIYFLFQ
ncbi:MAG TPA: hypothetical protein VK308_07905 [Pyrinomonadaceae bacterium]|nr:hypothetical protein [Pyrinomonadaceae bacterium]